MVQNLSDESLEEIPSYQQDQHTNISDKVLMNLLLPTRGDLTMPSKPISIQLFLTKDIAMDFFGGLDNIKYTTF